MNTTNRPTTMLPWATKDEGPHFYVHSAVLDCERVAEFLLRSDRQYAIHAANAYPKLMDALRALLIAAETRPVLAGDGVKAVREAGKFMKAIDTARAVLAECEEA